MSVLIKKVRSAGFVDPNIICLRPIGLRKFDCDFIAITVAGEAIFILKELGISATIEEASLVYVPAGQEHIYDPQSRKSWKNFWVLFDQDSAEKAFKNLLPTPGITTLNKLKGIKQHWEKMITRTLENEATADNHAFCLLHNILYDISTLSPSMSQSIATQNTLDIMHNNVREAELDFKKIALEHGIGLDTLRKKFKLETNLSLHQYFIQIKINVAKTMLKNPSYNISDIAIFLGFDDPYYFSRLFKKKTGLSPKKYREQLTS